MVATAKAARERGVHSMVGFNYRRVPALALAQRRYRRGPDRRRPPGARRLPAGLARRRRRPDDVAAAHASSPAPARWATSAPTPSTRCASCSARRSPPSTRSPTRSSRSARAPTASRTSPSTTPRGACLRTDAGAVVSLEVSRMATARKNALGIEVYGSNGALRFDLERSTSLDVCLDGADSFSRQLVTEQDTPTSTAGGRPATSSAGTHTFTNQAADFLAALAAGRSRPRRSRTGSPSSACSQRSRPAPPAVGSCVEVDGEPGLMGRPFTLFTGQWADLPLEEVARLAAGWGYDGLEIAVSGEHLDAWRWDDDEYVAERLGDPGASTACGCWAISNHLTGQAVCDDPIDFRHQAIVRDRVWGDGDPEGVRQRAAEEMKLTARLAQKLGVEDGRRLHRLLDLAVRRDVPARARRAHRGRLPGLRRPVEPDPRRLRRVRRAVRPRGAPLRDRLRLLDDRAHARGDRPPCRRSASTGTPAT